MTYRLSADLVVLIHFFFIVFVVLGALLQLRWRWTIWLHIPAFIWGVAIEIGGWICPLTPLENRLRVLSGQHGYEETFVEHYIVPLIYPVGLTTEIQYLLAAFVLIVNAGIYWYMYRKAVILK